MIKLIYCSKVLSVNSLSTSNRLTDRFSSTAMVGWLQHIIGAVCSIIFCAIPFFSQLPSLGCFSQAYELCGQTQWRITLSPFFLIHHRSLPLSYFYLSSFATQKRVGAREVRNAVWTPRTKWKLWGRCYPEQVAPSWHDLHLHNPWRHKSSDVSLSVFLSLPHAVFPSAATWCQIESVPTPQAWGNAETSLPFCSLFSSSFPLNFFLSLPFFFRIQRHPKIHSFDGNL